MHELWTKVEEILHNITAEPCQTLIESITSRVATVVKAKGGRTKYQNGALKIGWTIGHAKTRTILIVFILIFEKMCKL